MNVNDVFVLGQLLMIRLSRNQDKHVGYNTAEDKNVVYIQKILLYIMKTRNPEEIITCLLYTKENAKKEENNRFITTKIL